MKKVLFVLEDYNELGYAETLLKKIGFDCMGLNSEAGLADKMLGFVPHLVICDGHGRKVNGLNLAQKTKRSKGLPLFLVILGAGESISDSDLARLQVSAAIRRPLHPLDLVQKVAQILELDADSLKAKMKKLGLFREEEDERFQIVSQKAESSPAPDRILVKDSPLSMQERLLRQKRFVENLPATKTDGIERKKVVEQTKDFRSREDDPEIRAIDEERQAFVKALFRK